jgi:GAF domain-containing protein
MRSLLDLMVGLAHRSLPGRPEASVTLMRRRRPHTAAFSGDLAMDLDESQYGYGYGPCLEAAATGGMVEVVDTRADRRWPRYLEAAARRGCLSSLSLPLPLHEGVVGALNVYARERAAFDEESRDWAPRLASYAAVVAGNMLLYEDAIARAANLELALRSRAVIDQAKGMLMERFRMTADQAFHAMTQVSMESNEKVRVVAERFVETGEFGIPRCAEPRSEPGQDADDGALVRGPQLHEVAELVDQVDPAAALLLE